MLFRVIAGGLLTFLQFFLYVIFYFGFELYVPWGRTDTGEDRDSPVLKYFPQGHDQPLILDLILGFRTCSWLPVRRLIALFGRFQLRLT